MHTYGFVKDDSKKMDFRYRTKLECKLFKDTFQSLAKGISEASKR